MFLEILTKILKNFFFKLKVIFFTFKRQRINLQKKKKICQLKKKKMKSSDRKNNEKQSQPRLSDIKGVSVISYVDAFAEQWTPNIYLETRDGEVLGRGIMLKTDHFAQTESLTHLSLNVLISGGPNYRQVRQRSVLKCDHSKIIKKIKMDRHFAHAANKKKREEKNFNVIQFFFFLRGAYFLIYLPFFLQKKKKKIDSKFATVCSGSANIELTMMRRLQSETLYSTFEGSMTPARSTLERQKSNDELETRKQCVWINLRQEPLVYINNRPFVLREDSHPFRNMGWGTQQLFQLQILFFLKKCLIITHILAMNRTFDGIRTVDLEALETRLKWDVLSEARRMGNVLVHREFEYQKLAPCWEAISVDTVETSKELYSKLQEVEGYPVQYYRVAVPPETSWECYHFDQVSDIVLRHIFDSPLFVINCQMGRGRSTLATIIVHMIFHKLGLLDVKDSSPPPQHMPLTLQSSLSRTMFERRKKQIESQEESGNDTVQIPRTSSILSTPVPIIRTRSVPQALSAANGIPITPVTNVVPRQQHLRRASTRRVPTLLTAGNVRKPIDGEYEIILKMLRLLKNGEAARRMADKAVAVCGETYNLHKDMKDIRKKLEAADTRLSRNFFLFQAIYNTY
ncbi:hypothetical protein RFI_10812, partial [Reticulomyxa filosa]